MVFPFVGSSYQLSALRADVQASWNLYLEVVESGTGKARMYLKRTPGLSLFSTITGSNGPVRGVWAGENRLFAVVGSNLYEIFQDGTFNNRGSVGSATTGPVQFAANGNQLFVVSGGQAYCDSGAGPVLVQFNGGAGLVNIFNPSGTVTTSNVGGIYTATVTAGSTFAQIPLGGVINLSLLGAFTVVAFDTTGTVATLATNPGNHTGVTWGGNVIVWASGDYFLGVAVGDIIEIGGAGAVVASVDPTATIITSKTAVTPGTLVGYSAFALDGVVNVVPNGSGGSTVTLLSGDAFDTRMVGGTITLKPSPILGTLDTYSVTAATPSQVTISSAVTLYNAPYGANVPLTAAGCTFFDTYFVVFQPSSKNINISANNDGTTWSALDFATKEGYPDNIAAIYADHEQMWVQGDEVASEIWQDTGNANFPLQRAPGGFVQYANLAPQTLCRFNNGIAWLGGDEVRGGPIMFFSSAWEPVRISNHAVETEWGTYTTYYDAIAFSYIEAGHHFLVVNFPSANKTWVYDAAASQQTGVAQWHQRGSCAVSVFSSQGALPSLPNGSYPIGSFALVYDSSVGSQANNGFYANVANVWTLQSPGTSVFNRQLQSTHAFVQGSLTSTASGGIPGSKTGPSGHYVGDATATPGKIYLQSETYLSDNNANIVRCRVAPAVSNEDVYTYFGPFELFANVNNNSVAPINPILDYSHDWGATFVNPQLNTSYNPALPNTNLTRLIWRRMGKSRGRVFRVYVVDMSDFALVDVFGDEAVGAA